MANQGLFSINQFAKFSRTTSHTLRYYDKIGLLAPISRGENDYRYYDSRQIAIINLIRTFQVLGMTLEEIKRLVEHRTPELMGEIFARQIEKIDIKMEEWIRAKKLLIALRRTINTALNIDENKVSIQFMPAETIVLGELNDYSRGRNDYDALYKFYKTMSKKYPNLDMNYSVWGTFSAERVKREDWIWPDRYYFNNPDGPDQKPAALYAIGYTRGGYGQSKDVYPRLLEHIEKNGFEICGDIYEEYPLNEICVVDKNSYLMRVMITVRQKHSR